MRILYKLQQIGLVLSLVFLLAVVSWMAVKAAPVPREDFSCATVTDIPQNECQTLVALYDSTGGPGWSNNTNWLTTNTPCEWEGVTCQDGQVGAIDLNENYLEGAIPPEVGDLANLQVLLLGNNQLSGMIPPELGKLANLQRLYLRNNQLSGMIPPELGNLTSLQELDLAVNVDLSGPVPPELGNLANLQRLYLRDNQLSGPIPEELGKLANLEVLSLGSNQLSGPIPIELSKSANLQVIYLRNNQLSGPIPPELGNLTKLQELDLAVNELSGPIPPDLGNLANLQRLYLRDNQLNGPIPSELGNLVNLNWLSLFGNHLSGPIPPQLGNLANLQHLYLEVNQLSGPIPPELGMLTKLQYLHLSNNQLSGLIPSELANLNALLELSLHYNALTANDPALSAFLTQKEPGWEATQTVAPKSVQTSVVTDDRIVVTWAPILYTVNGGYYEISYATDPAGPFTVHGVTPDKSSSQYELTGLAPDTIYFVRVRTYTPAHDLNQNDLWSGYSEVVPATNVIANPGFEQGKTAWAFYTDGQGYFNTDSRAYAGNAAARITIDQAAGNTQLFQTGFVVKPQTRYRLSFAAYSTNGHDLSLYLHQHGSPYQNYGLQNFRFNLTRRWQQFTVEFTTRNLTSATTGARLRFRLAQAAAGDHYWIDEVALVELPPGVNAAALPGVGAVSGAVQGVVATTTVKLTDLATGGSLYQMAIATDAAGAFRFDQVPMGAYELSVEPPTGYLTPEPMQLLVSEQPNEEFVFVIEAATNSVYLPMISH